MKKKYLLIILLVSAIGYPHGIGSYNLEFNIPRTDISRFNGIPELNINGTYILRTNMNNYLSKLIIMRQTACSVWVNTINYCMKKHSKKAQPIPDASFNNSFIPEPGKYIVSGWVKEDIAKQQITYAQSNITIAVNYNNAAPFYSETFKASGAIIDGWQRIVGIVTIPVTNPQNNPKMEIKLNCTSTTADCYFDDIRFFPYNGNLKSFVYDEDTQKLMAELDENNYATYYEYDLEGGLVRVKKETEKGVYTIQETRSNSSKSE